MHESVGWDGMDKWDGLMKQIIGETNRYKDRDRQRDKYVDR
jgi:hypothetical protein